MATKVFMEALSPTMEEGRLVKWLKSEGDVVKSGEPIGEVETDKAIMELVARGDGVLRKRLVNEGDAVPVGTLVGVIAAKDENIDALVSGGGATAATAATAVAAPAAPAPAANAPQSAAPSPAASAPPTQLARQAPAAPAQPAPQPASAPSGNGEHVRSSPLARRLASERGVNLGSVQGSGPGGRIIKRDIENAHWLGDHIRYFNRVHLGMAVATDDGLIVPVIWDADTKRLSEISRQARELAKRARERKLKPEEFTGSTFSVSNLGMFGIDQFTAIINPPEAGIIAIGTGEDKLVVEKGEAVIRKRVRLTMSCDHRVIDGAVGAKFLQALRRLVENPLMLVY